MTLRQLEYFLAVVDEHSFTRAAEKLRVAQPSLSHQLRALENELGVRLLDRLPRDIVLTPAGRALLPHARAAVAHCEGGVRAARNAVSIPGEHLEVAAVRSLVVGVLPEAIRRWRAANGGTLRLHEFEHRQQLEESVRHGVGDVGIGPRPRRWDGPVETLGWQGFALVVSRDDPLAVDRRPVRLDVLRDRLWVTFEPSHGLFDIVLAACANAGFTPRSAVETSQVEAAVRLAAAGLGPALLPAIAIPAEVDAHVLAIDPPVGHEIAAYARTESAVVSTFIEAIRAQELPRRPDHAIEIR